MEQNKQQLAALKKLLDLPHNKQCADCVGGGGAARASRASINTGVFICMRCAGIHRGLGVHVSKVRRPTCTVLPLLAVSLSRHSQECGTCGDPPSRPYECSTNSITFCAMHIEVKVLVSTALEMAAH